MTGSTHVYTAVVQGTPDIDLPLHDDAGRITLDASASPHVQATLRLGKVDASLLELLDTRQNPIPRVTIDVAATFPTGSQSRSFDLNVRGWARDQETGEPVLSLASDEALLEDGKALYEEYGAFTRQTSLRDVVDYALDLVIPGAALEATPTDDADVSVYSDSENYVDNPIANAGLTGWQFYGGGTPNADTGQTWTDNASGTAFRIAGPGSGVGGFLDWIWSGSDADAIFGGKSMRFSANVRPSATITGLTADSAAMAVFYRVVGGSYVRTDDAGFVTAATVRQRRINRTFPDGLDSVIFRMYHGYTSSVSVRWSDVRVSVSNTDVEDWDYFSGDSVDTAGYQYDWEGTAHASRSTRTALIDREPDSLRWKAGTSAIEFLRPLLQNNGLRLVCNEQRQWTLRSATYTAAGSTIVEYADNLITGSEAIDRDDDIWCDACVVRYSWVFEGDSFERTDTYTSSPTPSRVRYIERSSPWPGVGFAQYVVERAQDLGRNVTATTVANWDTTTEQPATFTLDNSPDLEGNIVRVAFDLSTDEMTVDSRTGEV